MSEPVYKRITDLPAATLPLATGDLLEVSQSGTSGKATFGGIFGSGWFAKLFAPLASFVAPEATHAVNADTLGAGADTATDLHDAAQLVGSAPLAVIPAELTGKNAATATTAAACSGNAATATTAAACSGNAASATVVPNCGMVNGATVPGTSDQIFVVIYVVSTGDIGFAEVHGGDVLNAEFIFYIRKS